MMKTYWLDNDRKKEEYFIKYAASSDRTLIPRDAVIAYVTEDKEVCGFSAIAYDGEAAYLLFFIIFEEYRGKGYGSFLLRDIIQRLSDAGITMLGTTLPSDMDVCSFFEAEGFDLFPGEEEYVTTFGELKYCEKYRKDIAKRSPAGTTSLKDCTGSQLQAIRRILAENDILEPRGYDMELSTVVLHKGRAASILLCESIPGGIIIRFMLFTSMGKPADLIKCLRSLDEKLSARDGSASLKLSFPGDPEGNLRLIEFLTGYDIVIERVNRGYAAVRRL